MTVLAFGFASILSLLFPRPDANIPIDPFARHTVKTFANIPIDPFAKHVKPFANIPVDPF